MTLPRRCFNLVVLLVVGLSTGCAGVRVPTVDVAEKLGVLGDIGSVRSDPSDRFRPVGQGVQLASATLTEPVYNAVQRARRENAVVLQVLGDEVPLRVLPLPPGGGDTPGSNAPSVYVSQLLTETGVQQKFGSLQATLYRAESGSIGGIQMDVLFDDSSGRMLPETDYALRSGDRLVVRRDDTLRFGSILGMALGR